MLNLDKEKQKVYNKERYEKNKEKSKLKQRIYSQIPEVKKRSRIRMCAYNQIPEVKKRKNLKQNEYRQRPEVKKRNKIIYDLPENKLKKEIYYQKVKLKVKKDRDNLDYKLSKKKYDQERRQIPEYKAKEKERLQKYHQRKEVKMRMNKNYKQRLIDDEGFRVQRHLKNYFSLSMNNHSIKGKIGPSKKYGVDYKAIVEHLQPFPKNMNDYHRDHIIPVSWFDHNNLKEIRWAWAPENFQWLRKELNGWKGNRFILPLTIEEQDVLMKKLFPEKVKG